MYIEFILHTEFSGFKSLIFQGPSVDEVRVANPMSKRPYLERINVAHSYASAELLDLIVNKVIHYSGSVVTI